LKQQIASLRETQFPRVAKIVESQRKLYEQEKWVAAELADDVFNLASEIEVVTRPFGAEAEAEKILGKDGDLGNYMEWAGPELLSRANRLARLLGGAGKKTDTKD